MLKHKCQISNKIVSWLIVVNFSFFIFFLSSIPELKSGLDTTTDIVLRKIAHALEFGLLSYFLFLALKNYQLILVKILIITLTFASIYALSDELHQSFVFGRKASIIDFLVDFCGILLIVSIIYNLKKEKNIQ